MAGIEFDRQVFSTVSETGRKPAPKILGTILLVIVLGLAGIVGYKIFTQVSDRSAFNAANSTSSRCRWCRLPHKKRSTSSASCAKPAW